ncbi:rhamnulokinase [Herbiconiux sp. VKM Ac-1786]|uniref:rhamnulokinase n=1 Tax=Herbiconiux sp. VKM Ac-1786 TaxID=2783824 RepID=UPI00188B9991|nr:FGGY-family carbohydrate kinase [Herbiconiux sp. VKM Ac-1786]MBF4573086.1 rhamnulokinase [Herbiconiux sp. VKM Ac-1786]
MPTTDRPAASGAHAYAAVDLGASSGRVMLGVVDRSEGSPRMRMTEVHRFANGPRPASLEPGATLEWDVERLVEETLEGLAAAVSAAASEGRTLAGIGVDSWGVDYGLVPSGEGGAAIPRVDHHRGAEPSWVEQAAAVVGTDQAYAATGIPPQSINTSVRLHAAADPAGTLQLVPDLLVRLLSGSVGAELTIASTTQLLDVRSGEWSRPLIDAWGLDRIDFPAVVAPGTPAGATLPHVTRRLGASQPVPVYRVAEHDTASALAFAAPGDGQLLVSSGSWSLAGISVAEPVLTAEALAAGLTNECGVGGSTLLLRNLAGLWLLTECARQWSAESGRMLDPVDLVREASRPAGDPAAAGAGVAAVVGGGVPVFDVGDPRLLAPGGMPERIAALCVERGQPAPEGVLGTVRSIVESLATAYAESVEVFERVAGTRIRSVRIVGGGSRNELLCRRTAALTGLPVVAGPAEASAFGNLAMQLVAAGEFSNLSDVYAAGGSAGGALAHYEPGEVAAR